MSNHTSMQRELEWCVDMLGCHLQDCWMKNSYMVFFHLSTCSLCVCISCVKVYYIFQPGWVWVHVAGWFALRDSWMLLAPPPSETLPSLCSDRPALKAMSRHHPLSPYPQRGSDAVWASHWTWTLAAHVHIHTLGINKLVKICIQTNIQVCLRLNIHMKTW